MTGHNPSEDLRRRLESLRALMAKTSGHPAGLPKVPVRVEGPLPAPRAGASNSQIVEWLTAMVLRHSGIAVTAQMMEKLQRMVEAFPQSDMPGWLQQLSIQGASHPQWASLLEALTIHETFFWRNPEQLAFTKTDAIKAVIERQKGEARPSLRLWSAACSTGEEAYSLAILALEALAEAGEVVLNLPGSVRFVRPWTFEVLGTDLSNPAVLRAKKGLYRDIGMGAFRSMPPQYWPFFTKEDEDPSGRFRTHQVVDAVRSFVRFEQFNLMDKAAPQSGFDVILCRNVLIYFDDQGKRHVYTMLHQALKQGGFAAFGPADMPLVSGLFQPIWGPQAVIYRRL